MSRGYGYKWLQRWRAKGEAGLEEQPRRPHMSPQRSSKAVEAAVLAVRKEHPAWGGRKIAAVLKRAGLTPPAASTVTNILRRCDMDLGVFGGGAKPFIRFEHERPNDLWQMDFKGHVAMQGGRLHPLTVLDDHSRFAIEIGACGNEQTNTVKTRLKSAFQRYGLPWRMAVDNGPPWGDSAANQITPLTVWLIERGIRVSHSTPLHPQTLGKAERFHRSLKAEVLPGSCFATLGQAQSALDAWRSLYNTKRPHEALGMAVPADRYRLSPRPYAGDTPPFQYAPHDLLRIVQAHGIASLNNQRVRIARALRGKTIAFRPTAKEGTYNIFFRRQFIKKIDLKALDTEPESVHDVCEQVSTMSPV